MLFNAHTFFPLSSSKASLATCINWFNNLPAEVKQAVLVYYIIHPSMIDKAKNSLDPSFTIPPIMDNTPLNTPVSSLFNPDKSNSLSIPAAKKSKSSSTPFNSQRSSLTRKFWGAKINTAELVDVQRRIDWSS